VYLSGEKIHTEDATQVRKDVAADKQALASILFNFQQLNSAVNSCVHGLFASFFFGRRVTRRIARFALITGHGWFWSPAMQQPDIESAVCYLLEQQYPEQYCHEYNQSKLADAFQTINLAIDGARPSKDAVNRLEIDFRKLCLTHAVFIPYLL
jgi:hypothetical protein